MAFCAVCSRTLSNGQIPVRFGAGADKKASDPKAVGSGGEKERQCDFKSKYKGIVDLLRFQRYQERLQV